MHSSGRLIDYIGLLLSCSLRLRSQRRQLEKLDSLWARFAPFLSETQVSETLETLHNSTYPVSKGMLAMLKSAGVAWRQIRHQHMANPTVRAYLAAPDIFHNNHLLTVGCLQFTAVHSSSAPLLCQEFDRKGTQQAQVLAADIRVHTNS